MPAPIGLREVPKAVLDSTRWTELRAFAASDLMALTLINAPFPDPENPTDFFWGRDSTFDDALRCYNIGRDLLSQCRRLLIERKLVATGIKPDGTREMINPTDWANLWPMFATNRATGPNQAFDDVEIHELTALETSDEKMLLDCLNWFRVQDPETSQSEEGGAPLSRKSRGRCKSHPRRLQRCLQGRSRALTWQAAEIGGEIF